MERGQYFFGLVAAVFHQKPGPERDDVGRFQFMQLLLPGIGTHDRGAVCVALDSRSRNRVLALTALVFAGVEPLLDGLIDGFDLGASRRVEFWQFMLPRNTGP